MNKSSVFFILSIFIYWVNSGLEIKTTDQSLPLLEKQLRVQRKCYVKAVCQTLESIDSLLWYWQSEKKNQTIVKTVFAWFGIYPSKTDIYSAINFLKEYQKKLFSDLGSFNILIQKGDTSGQIKFLQSKLLSTKKNTDDPLITSESIHSYKKYMFQQLAPYKKTHHLVRNIIPYTLTGITLFTLMAYQKQLTETSKKNIEGLKRFWNKHIISLFHNIKEEIFNPSGDMHISKNALIASDKSLEDRIVTYRLREARQKNYLTSWFSTSENTKKIIDSAKKEAALAKGGNLSKIERDFNREIQNPIINTVNGPLLRILDIRFEAYKNIGLKDAYFIEQLTNRFKFVLEVLLASGSSYLLYKFGQYGFKWFEKNNVHRPIKILLIECEKYLNAQNLGITEKLDPHTHGKIIFNCYRIKMLEQLIPDKSIKAFKSDLKEIKSIKFTINQKLNTISRMFRQYSFLATF